MDQQYKYEIIGKLLRIFGVIYFVIGFFSTYSWSCKELDKISEREKINEFWNPIGGITGTINFVIFLLIITVILRGKRLAIINASIEDRILFYALCLPLFLATIVYTILGMVFYGMKLKENNYTFWFILAEMFLFIGTKLVIININFKIWTFVGKFEKLLSQFILLIATVGMINCFLFHLAIQQITNFIEVASNSSAYSKFYNSSIIPSDIPFNFYKIKKYMQPLLMLFCCTCIVYIIKFNFSKGKSSKNSETVQLIDQFSDGNDSIENSREYENELLSDDNNLENVINTNDEENSLHKSIPSFRLPPFSLVLGILLITLSLLAVAILNSFLKSEQLYMYGQYLLTIFLIPIYIYSIFLLYMQIIEMEKWPKLNNNKNIVDKSLVWIGIIGIVIIVISQIELFIFTNNPTISALKYFHNIVKIIQAIIQTITISLALDRQCCIPERKSWHEYICPSFGILSTNIVFLIFNVYLSVGDVYNLELKYYNISDLYLKIFGNGFHSIGETLQILQSLHSSLMFIKIIVYTNN